MLYSSIFFIFVFFFFFFNDTATTEIYTLSLHDALPILPMLASTRFAGLYDLRSRVRKAFTTIGRALDAKRMVDTVPARRATLTPVMSPTVGIRGDPPRRTEYATLVGRSLRRLS